MVYVSLWFIAIESCGAQHLSTFDTVHQDFCTTLYVAATAVEKVVYINQYFNENTTINIAGGVHININNAPTQFVTTLVVTQTQNVTQISTTTLTSTSNPLTALPSSLATPTSTGSPITTAKTPSFGLLIAPLTPVTTTAAGVKRRQVTVDLLDGKGLATNNCTGILDSASSQTFNIANGQLSLSASGFYFSTSGQNSSALFAASPVIGAISTEFTLSNQGVLEWRNETFQGGIARFCLKSNQVTAVFSGALPTNCAEISLQAAATCISSSTASSPSSSAPSSSETILTAATTPLSSASPVLLPSVTQTPALSSSAGQSSGGPSFTNPSILSTFSTQSSNLPLVTGLSSPSSSAVQSPALPTTSGSLSSFAASLSSFGSSTSTATSEELTGTSSMPSLSTSSPSLSIPITPSIITAISTSFAFSHSSTNTAPATSPGIPSSTIISTDQLAAAEAIIVGQSYQTFCSDILGHMSGTLTSTSTESVIVTSIITGINAGTSIVDFTPTVTATVTGISTETNVVPTTRLNVPYKRNVANMHDNLEARPLGRRQVQTPELLATFPADIVTSACLMQVTATNTAIEYVYETATFTSVSSAFTDDGLGTTITSTYAEVTSFITVQSTTTDSIVGTQTTMCADPSATVSSSGFVRYYSGSGFRESENNPGNDNPANGPPQILAFNTTAHGCPAIEEAVETCATYSINVFGGYFAFDLHFLTNVSQWECVAYLDYIQTGQYFTVADPNVYIAFGYSL
ncbi:hypothetical protein BP6252_13014 [Coleophoma cylindrospora]|uniref:DUF7908 domain-containing protein n=1 Tax=Coleophoma cylindrospora TaxID=1849047 RepID=A0A3D8QDW9_9HELO|nr:hypothetical protein BP6252_13014 [Coleophoma cylindrospora]